MGNGRSTNGWRNFREFSRRAVRHRDGDKPRAALGGILSLNIRSEGTSSEERICREVQPRESSLRMDLHPKTPWKRFPSLVTRLPRSSNIFHVFFIQKIREPILAIRNSHLDAPVFSENQLFLYDFALPLVSFLSSTNRVIIKAQQADDSRYSLNRLRDGSSVSSSLRSTRRQSRDVSQRR